MALPFDFYLPDFHVVIEADGEQHYFPVDFGGLGSEIANEQFHNNQKHDAIKTQYCKTNQLQLIRIPYWERDSLEYFLWDQLVACKVIEDLTA